MDQLAPQHVPVYETDRTRRSIWEECAKRNQPVVAIRDAARGFIVRYDIQHIDAELSTETVRALREQTRTLRSYPTGTDPISQAEGVGGEAGAVSGDLHTDSEQAARRLASKLSGFVFDRSNWQTR
jgi:hypothetical protein